VFPIALPSALLAAAAAGGPLDAATLTLVILLSALVLFATEWVRPDITAMVVVLALAGSRVLTPQEATAGLGNEVVITIAAMFVVGHAVLKTGAASWFERAVLAFGGRSETGLIAVSFLAVAVLSAWIQNVAAIVLFLPAVIGVARARGLSASRLLMPLAAASLTGGMCTLVGSPANLALAAWLPDQRAQNPGMAGLEDLRMFETLGIGAAMAATACLYFAFAGPRLLPARRKEESLSETYAVKQFLTEVLLRPGSPIVGAKLHGAGLGERYGVTVLGLIRDGAMLEAPDPWLVLRENDVLLVQGESEGILRLRRDHALEVVPRADVGDRTLRTADLVLAEVMLAPNSRLVNRSVAEVGITGDYGLNGLAVARHGESLRTEIGRVRLRIGDVVLVQGHVEGMERMRRSPDWLVLEEGPAHPFDRGRAIVSVAVLLGVMLLATATPVRLAFAAVLGVVALVIGGVLRRREVYEAIEWPVVILIAGVLPLGTALEKTGLADRAARFLAETVGAGGPTAALATVYLVATIFTGFLNNAALTIMLAPVALGLAGELHVSPRPLLVAVAIGAAADFLTPIGQSNALVMGPGQYRFRDYFKVGAPLTFLCFVVAMVGIPILWPF